MKKIILFALSALSVSAARAQVTISPVGGLNISNVAVSDAPASEKPRIHFGPCVGALVDLPSKSKLSLQTGLLYKLNGYREDVNTIYGTQQGDFLSLRLSALEIPVKLTYSISDHNGTRIFIGVGPYLAMNIAASVRMHGHYYDAAGNPIGTMDEIRKVDIGENGIKRMDAGGGLNFGYRAAKGLLIVLQGQYGLVNMSHSSEVTVHNYNFGVVAGYSFKLKKHQAAPKSAQSK